MALVDHIVHTRLQDLVKTALYEIVLRNVFLEKLEKGSLTSTEWRMFAEQRYIAARPFDALLLAGIRAAENAHDIELQQALQANYNDEMGIDEHGVEHPDRSHEQWRRDFYSELGIDDAMLSQVVPLQGTKEYLIAFEDVMREGDCLKIAGALLVLEATIPTEFKRIKQGRDATFQDVFVDANTDTVERRLQKKKARMYIDDHILHDAAAHYPDLLNALLKYESDPAAFDRIRTGAAKVTEAKKKFYEDLFQAIKAD